MGGALPSGAGSDFGFMGGALGTAVGRGAGDGADLAVGDKAR